MVARATAGFDWTATSPTSVSTSWTGCTTPSASRATRRRSPNAGDCRSIPALNETVVSPIAACRHQQRVQRRSRATERIRAGRPVHAGAHREVEAIELEEAPLDVGRRRARAAHPNVRARRSRRTSAARSRRSARRRRSTAAARGCAGGHPGPCANVVPTSSSTRPAPCVPASSVSDGCAARAGDARDRADAREGERGRDATVARVRARRVDRRGAVKRHRSRPGRRRGARRGAARIPANAPESGGPHGPDHPRTPAAVDRRPRGRALDHPLRRGHQSRHRRGDPPRAVRQRRRRRRRRALRRRGAAGLAVARRRCAARAC